VKLLHTSDWHVGKTIRGRSRAEEHEAVLAEITAVAAAESVDLVLVVGDLFETAAPLPDAEAIVYRHLQALAATGARVAVVAGNHDNARRLAAVAPLLHLAGVHVVTEPQRPEEGGVWTFTTAAGERVNLALLPFVSQRGIVRAEDLMAAEVGDSSAKYAARLRAVVETLCQPLRDDPDAVNVLAAHAMVAGGVLGGGERAAHTIFEYAVKTSSFPDSLHYVALGHLHRPQRVPGGPPIWYSGSPLQLDFGETGDEKAVLVVEASAGSPAAVRQVPLQAGRRLQTIEGPLASIRPLAGTTGDDWLRVRLDETPRPGLADEVRDLFPHVVDVLVTGSTVATEPPPARLGRTPSELFAEYLAERDAVDSGLTALFDELLDEAVRPEPEPAP
jgi:exonuclease SbcD